MNCAVVASTLAVPARLPVSYVELRSPLNVTSGPACVRHEPAGGGGGVVTVMVDAPFLPSLVAVIVADPTATPATSPLPDRKSTRLNSSHVRISYAVFCLQKKNPTSPPLLIANKKKTS